MTKGKYSIITAVGNFDSTGIQKKAAEKNNYAGVFGKEGKIDTVFNIAALSSEGNGKSFDKEQA